MALLSSYISLLPTAFQNRYTASGHFVAWCNELLEELQERGFLPTQRKEIGVLVENDRWIDKPSDLINLEKIWLPDNPDFLFRVEDVNNKFKLKDEVLDVDETTWVHPAGFSDYAAGSLTLNYTGLTAVAEDELENYMLMITAGSLAGTGIIIHSNTATTANETEIVFMHELDAALSGTKITAADIVPSTDYLMMSYLSIITAITAVSDEVPISTDCEKRLLPAWLRWCCERQAMATSNETRYWEAEKNRVLYSLQSSRLNNPITPTRGRRLPGLENKFSTMLKSHPDYSEY